MNMMICGILIVLLGAIVMAWGLNKMSRQVQNVGLRHAPEADRLLYISIAVIFMVIMVFIILVLVI